MKQVLLKIFIPGKPLLEVYVLEGTSVQELLEKLLVSSLDGIPKVTDKGFPIIYGLFSPRLKRQLSIIEKIGTPAIVEEDQLSLFIITIIDGEKPIVTINLNYGRKEEHCMIHIQGDQTIGSLKQIILAQISVPKVTDQGAIIEYQLKRRFDLHPLEENCTVREKIDSETILYLQQKSVG